MPTRSSVISVVLAASVTVTTGSLTGGRLVAQRPVTALQLQPSDVAGIPGGGRCGTYDVYENRAARTGRLIALNVVVIPATGPRPAPDPIVWLEGGPGGAATQAAGPASQQYFRGARATRDLIFVDQRGTGNSNPLRCGDIGETPSNLPGYFGKLFPQELIRACRASLERVADLTQYTTAIAMDDLDAVREALGYARINLAGASYGTLAAPGVHSTTPHACSLRISARNGDSGLSSAPSVCKGVTERVAANVRRLARRPPNVAVRFR